MNHSKRQKFRINCIIFHLWIRTVFEEIDRQTTQILTVRLIIIGVRGKNLEAIHLFEDFSKSIDAIHRAKMEQIYPACSLKETVTATMMLYKDMKAMVCSLNSDSRVRKGDT